MKRINIEGENHTGPTSFTEACLVAMRDPRLNSSAPAVEKGLLSLSRS